MPEMQELNTEPRVTRFEWVCSQCSTTGKCSHTDDELKAWTQPPYGAGCKCAKCGWDPVIHFPIPEGEDTAFPYRMD